METISLLVAGGYILGSTLFIGYMVLTSKPEPVMIYPKKKTKRVLVKSYFRSA